MLFLPKSSILSAEVIAFQCSSKVLTQYTDFELFEREWFLLMVDELSCAACKEIFSVPVILNCGHIVCLGCVKPKVSQDGMIGPYC